MNRKSIILLCVGGVVVLIISIIIGWVSATRETPDHEITAFPIPTDTNAEDALSGTIIEETGNYKIILSGATLKLLDNDTVVYETTITPDVLPRADVKALSSGIEYNTMEDALVDWESLCK